MMYGLFSYQGGWMWERRWFFLALMIWEMFWKGKAMWKAAKKSEAGWFWILFIVNTLGILPILYLNYFSKQKGKK